MYKIIFIALFFVVNMTGAHSETKVWSVGVPTFLKFKKDIQKFKFGEFHFEKDEFPSTSMTKLENRKVDMAILPPENSIQAVWHSESAIKFKVGKRFMYVVAPKQFGRITKEKLINKKINVTLKSAGDFYLGRFLVGALYEKINKSTPEIISLLNHSVSPGNGEISVLEESVFHDLKNKNKFQFLRIEAGNYYFLTTALLLFQEVETTIPGAFLSNGIKLEALTDADKGELKDLNKFLLGKAWSKAFFEIKMMNLNPRINLGD